MTVQEAKSKWINWLKSQVGYQEIGDNQTKYATDSDLDTRLYGFDMNGLAWCDYFADYSYMYNFGFELGVKMTYQFVGCQGAACRYSAEYYKQNNAWFNYPEVGDQVFFYYSGAINHTELVIAVNYDSNGNWTGFNTVGGNSSDAVRQNTYTKGASTIAGFGRPNWALVATDEIDSEETTAETTSTSDSGGISAGDLVSIVTGAHYYNGGSIPAWVLTRKWLVHSVSGDRAVINKSEDGALSIMSPINVSYLVLSNSSTVDNTSAETQSYTVQKGDTLWAIAKTILGNPLRYTEIKALNGLTTNIIQVGAVLSLPKN